MKEKELEKLLSGKAGAAEVAKLMARHQKLNEGIDELDGLPDDEKKDKPDEAGTEGSSTEKSMDKSEDAESVALDDDDLAEIGGVDDNSVVADLKDAFIDFAINLATMGNDDLQTLLSLDPAAPCPEDGTDGTSADLGPAPNDGLKTAESGDDSNAQVAQLQKACAEKDAVIKDLKAQLAAG